MGYPLCHGVIVMTFWYVLWNGLNFFELFQLLFLLGIDHDPLCFLCSHDLCFILHTITWPREVILYYDLFDFGVLLFYGRTPTFIPFYFLHKPTTPILSVYVDQRRPHLEKNTTRPRGMVIWKIPTVPRRTLVTPD